jgi:hypothetical protein
LHFPGEICGLCQKTATGTSSLRPNEDPLKKIGSVWFFNAPCV